MVDDSSRSPVLPTTAPHCVTWGVMPPLLPLLPLQLRLDCCLLPCKNPPPPYPGLPSPHWGNPETSHRTSHLEKGDNDCLPPKGSERPVGTSHGQGDHRSGRREGALLSPSEKPRSCCPLFPLGEGENQLPGLGRLILPQHFASMGKKKKKKSDHEMGLKFSVYHGSRTPIRCPVALCLQMKMLCATEELQ